MQHSITVKEAEFEEKTFHHMFACGMLPMLHPSHSKIGKPVEIWCNDLYEPDQKNYFVPLDNLKTQVFCSVDYFCEEKVLITIPFLN